MKQFLSKAPEERFILTMRNVNKYKYEIYWGCCDVLY